MTTNQATSIAASVVDAIKSNFDPDDVFTEDQLNDWAVSNGYTKEIGTGGDDE